MKVIPRESVVKIAARVIVYTLLGILAVWSGMQLAGCASSDELISPAKQACLDERARVKAEIWEAQREHPGRTRVYRRIPRCGSIE